MSSPISFPELYKAGFDDFIIPSHEIAPFTTIQNRAKVTRSLKAIAGVERIMVRGVNRLQNEFGPNGEQVWEADNKDSRIRFVGIGWNQLSNTYGAYIQSTTTNDYVEVSFYGTGLNVIVCAANSVVDVRPSVDGGAEGSDIFPAVISTVIGNRNYAPNIVVPVVSGLTLGPHTVKLRISSSALEFTPNGFEILNERSNLAVYQGSGIAQGALNGLSSLATSSFTDGVTGTRGARVVKYIDNGTLKSAVQEVDATSKYLTLADHTNEEVVRRINFREFGANRADDFSTLAATGSSRAFTLDDGTTTLVGSTVKGDTALSTIDALRAQAGVTNFFTKTFIGTGLDVIISCDATIRSTTVLVDGVSVGTLISAVTINGVIYKICSGLPYGTHTIKFLNTSAGSDTFGVSDFIIYQPKKPSIPAGALEVADYNVMASYVVSPSFLKESVSTGVLRKSPARERTYVGAAAWTIGLDVLHPSGFSLFGSTAGMYLEFSFFGTGIELKGLLATGNAINRTYSIDGSTNLTGYTIGVGGATGLTFTAATGVLSGTPTTSQTYGETIFIRGLPLGHHVLRATWNSGYTFYNDTIDIITPIHINQPSLKTGSLSLKSATKYSPEKAVSNAGPDLSKAKAWVVFDGVNQIIYSSYNVQAVLRTATGVFYVYFEKPFKTSGMGRLFGGSVLVSSSLAETQNSGFTNSYCLIETSSSSGVKTNAGLITMVAYGELVDE